MCIRDRLEGSRATTNRHLHVLCDQFGLLNREFRKGSTDLEYANPVTGELTTRVVPVQESWFEYPGNLIDTLERYARFKREEPSTHGGKRTRHATIVQHDEGIALQEARSMSHLDTHTYLQEERAA